MDTDFGEASVSEIVIKRIFQNMLKKYLTDREVLREKVGAEGKRLVFIHELCECSYKQDMRRRFPEIERAQAYSSRFALGEMIEEALRTRFGVAEECQYLRELEIDNKVYVVSGTIDIRDTATKTPIEVKYQTSLTGVPHEHHILQLRLYLWLVHSSKGELLYASPDGLKAYGIENPATDGEVISLIKYLRVPRWIEWECGYCPYESFCSKSTLRKR